MGLRIDTNQLTLPLLRQIWQTQQEGINLFERVATGIRVTRPAIEPATFMIGELLRGQLGTTQQAIENIQNAQNIVQTAEAGMAQVGERLQELSRLAVRAGMPLSPEQQLAIQQQVNMNIEAINRIAQTTRFGGLNLLGGQMGFQITQQSPEIQNINIISGAFTGGFPQTVQIQVTQAAQAGQAAGTLATQPEAATIEIGGARGTVRIEIPAGATPQEIAQLINQYTEQTGVQAVEQAPGEFVLRATEVGSQQFVRVINVEGQLAGITPGIYYGTDIQATVGGVPAAGRGNVIIVQTPELAAQITMQAGVTGEFEFTIGGGGAGFQVGPIPTERMFLGFPNMGATMLGVTSGIGALQTIATGGANQLTQQPARAQQIIQAAISEVGMARVTFGAFEQNILGAQRTTLQSMFENISAARSQMIEANMPEVISQLRFNILRQGVNINLLRQGLNLTPANILQLLT